MVLDPNVRLANIWPSLFSSRSFQSNSPAATAPDTYGPCSTTMTSIAASANSVVKSAPTRDKNEVTSLDRTGSVVENGGGWIGWKQKLLTSGTIHLSNSMSPSWLSH